MTSNCKQFLDQLKATDKQAVLEKLQAPQLNLDTLTNGEWSTWKDENMPVEELYDKLVANLSSQCRTYIPEETDILLRERQPIARVPQVEQSAMTLIPNQPSIREIRNQVDGEIGQEYIQRESQTNWRHDLVLFGTSFAILTAIGLMGTDYRNIIDTARNMAFIKGIFDIASGYSDFILKAAVGGVFSYLGISSQRIPIDQVRAIIRAPPEQQEAMIESRPGVVRSVVNIFRSAPFEMLRYCNALLPMFGTLLYNRGMTEVSKQPFIMLMSSWVRDPTAPFVDVLALIYFIIVFLCLFLFLMAQERFQSDYKRTLLIVILTVLLHMLSILWVTPRIRGGDSILQNLIAKYVKAPPVVEFEILDDNTSDHITIDETRIQASIDKGRRFSKYRALSDIFPNVSLLSNQEELSDLEQMVITAELMDIFVVLYDDKNEATSLQRRNDDNRPYEKVVFYNIKDDRFHNVNLSFTVNNESIINLKNVTEIENGILPPILHEYVWGAICNKSGYKDYFPFRNTTTLQEFIKSATEGSIDINNMIQHIEAPIKNENVYDMDSDLNANNNAIFTTVKIKVEDEMVYYRIDDVFTKGFDKDTLRFIQFVNQSMLPPMSQTKVEEPSYVLNKSTTNNNSNASTNIRMSTGSDNTHTPSFLRKLSSVVGPRK